MKVSKGQSQAEVAAAAFLILYMVLGSPFLYQVLIATHLKHLLSSSTLTLVAAGSQRWLFVGALGMNSSSLSIGFQTSRALGDRPLGPPVVPFFYQLFWGTFSPTKMNYRQKGSLILSSPPFGPQECSAAWASMGAPGMRSKKSEPLAMQQKRWPGTPKKSIETGKGYCNWKKDGKLKKGWP